MLKRSLSFSAAGRGKNDFQSIRSSCRHSSGSIIRLRLFQDRKNAPCQNQEGYPCTDRQAPLSSLPERFAEKRAACGKSALVTLCALPQTGSDMEILSGYRQVPVICTGKNRTKSRYFSQGKYRFSLRAVPDKGRWYRGEGPNVGSVIFLFP